MSTRKRASTAIGAAMSALSLSAVLNVAEARGAPLPEFCVPPAVADNVCTVRLASVTANVTDGTITGTPAGGGSAITLAGQAEAYLKSAGFGASVPGPIQRWDSTIDSVGIPDPSDPNWYGNAKARAFLPRTLNDLATQFPPNVLVARFSPDDAQPGWFRLVSIQPISQ
ncbi:hypothetical protein [Mycobacterium asiaticum]|uniref:hypothetical protein n=1 Tax=Mycobacterium asiaticum TaxID=1790 RepID=UPI0007EFB93E|nr:hypothetical protein [Mycobacterium asiaticum]OBI87859.1 hypothetical protein A5661_07240 [Mycobacterium asiaticum]OBJ50281.1 hypothetical protein A9W94_28400 [Mycobacterium asiaticum]